MAQLESQKSLCVKILSGWEDNGPIFFPGLWQSWCIAVKLKEEIYVVVTKNE